MMLHGSIQSQAKHVHLEWFGDEVVGTGADCGNGCVQAPERGDDDDRHIGPVGSHALAQLKPIGPGHVQVRDDHVEVALGHGGQRFSRGRAPSHLESAPDKPRLQQLAHAAVVVDDQDAPTHDSPRGK